MLGIPLLGILQSKLHSILYIRRNLLCCLLFYIETLWFRMRYGSLFFNGLAGARVLRNASAWLMLVEAHDWVIPGVYPIPLLLDGSHCNRL